MKLNIERSFTDKYDESKKYKIGDVIDVDEARGKELLEDSRKLVSLNSSEETDKPAKRGRTKKNTDE